jgi:hypothetical protein
MAFCFYYITGIFLELKYKTNISLVSTFSSLVTMEEMVGYSASVFKIKLNVFFRYFDPENIFLDDENK